MKFFDRVRAIQRRPEFWLIEDRWATAASYFVGFADGDPTEPLAGFHEWATRRMGRGETSESWESVLFQTIKGEPLLTRSLELDEDLNRQALNLMYELLFEFEKRPR